MLSRCFHFGVFEIFVSSLFGVVRGAGGGWGYGGLYKWEAESQEEDHDGRWRLYLPHRCCTGSAYVLRTLTLSADDRWRLSRVPHIPWSSATSGIHGYSGMIHLLGSSHSRFSHHRFHPGLLSRRIPCRTDHSRDCSLHRCGTHLHQAAERSALQA